MNVILMVAKQPEDPLLDSSNRFEREWGESKDI